MPKGKNSSGVVLAVCTAIVCAAVLYSLRYSYLSCSDSVSEFVYGRIYDFGFAFRRTLDFSLQRGRFGLIFPFVVAVRYQLLGSGSPFAFWALQYIPICVNVVLLSFILGRRAGVKCGLLLSLLFASLLQVNGWHSLITCYPLDFMYGLALALTGLCLFIKSTESKKNGLLLKIVSAFLFYESMQTYEAFLTVAAVYLVLSISVLKREGKLSFKNLVISLDAHMITGILFIAMRVFVMFHPIVPLQDGVEDLTRMGNPKDFVITLGAFSGGMFPLADLVHPRVRSRILADGFEIRDIVVSLVAGIGMFMFMKTCRKDEKAAAKVKVIGLCGIVGALCFPLIHSLTSVYQKWVVEGHQFGYVPTTISYFGWIVFITCAVSYLPLSGRTKGKAAPYVAGIVLFTASLLTCGINHALIVEKIGPTSITYSYRTQLFLAAAKDSYCSKEGYDLVYAPDFEGVHDSMMFHEIMLENESETPYDVFLISSPDEYYSTAPSYKNPGVILYDEDSDTAIITDSDEINEGHTVTLSDIRIISAHGGSFSVSYEDNGTTISHEITLKPGEGVTIANEAPVDTASIDVVAR
ncbi:hypothetical protein SAMN06296952_0861 [Oscillospiraceae bacterium]|nr:hypothetical protein SAMN06296952_0861 [Oscillospiraceae bacterium]